MSYQVIARKWRPQTFEEVTGQEAITRTLKNAVEFQRLHHAYMFSGARGVGKTTTARLLAKALNCHKTDKPNPVPCSPTDADPCVSCAEIAEGRSIDVMEIDAASNTGVQNVRDSIIDTLNIRAARDRYKIFIIDEVHQLSKQAFDALLKSLEEPPPNVAFIMATTELHKVPDTILSRCQEFQFRIIATAKIYDRLKLVADTEKINISDDALREIARAGEGSMRDAQSAFDQVISFSGEQIGVEDVINALGLTSSETLASVVRAISKRDTHGILSAVEDLIQKGQDLRNFCRDLQAFLRDALVAKVPNSYTLLESALLGRSELNELAKDFSEADLIRSFHALSQTENELRTAAQPRYTLEIGLLKLVEMGRLKPIEELLEQLANLENSARTPGSKSESQAAATVSAPDSGPAVNTEQEKKTLETDFSDAERITKNVEPLERKSDNPVIAQTTHKPNGNGYSVDLDSFPVKLPPISPEELEHAEDTWLDAAYEARLKRDGDDLTVLKGASALVVELLGAEIGSAIIKPIAAEAVSMAAVAASSSLNTESFSIQPAAEKITNEPENAIALPANPSDEDLLRYAEANPAVARILKIFRGKIVKVEKKPTNQ